MTETNSLAFYDDGERAGRYHRRGSFAPERSAKMREVLVDLITALTPPQAALLELGAGTGHVTQMLLDTQRFREIYVTDGAPAMLQIAQETLKAGPTQLQFHPLDFTTDWSGQFAGIEFDAVTSSLALHHAADKQALFDQIYSLLKPQGVFVLADHIDGASDWTQHLTMRERALIRIGRENQDNLELLQETMRIDAERGRKEGNLCESPAQYLHYMTQSGFADAECIWRDYWLAVFVARKQ